MALSLLLATGVLAAATSGPPAVGTQTSPPATAPAPLGLPCAEYPGGDTVCSGEVRSFDGSPLDVDVTLPSNSSGGGPHPLIVMLHGFGNNKHEWESTTDAGDGADKYHWNSHWFAAHGYYVLTYTARGFTDQGTTRPDQPETPAGTDPSCRPPTAGTGSSAGSNCLPSGTIRVKNKEVEIRDTQYLAALTAAAFPDIDPRQVAVSGGSYGGGESWLQAADPLWTFPHDIDPGLPVLRLQVAVPKYGWTDLAYSLVPNGHPGFLAGDPIYSSSQGAPDAHGVGNPIGAAKQSYIGGLYSLGTTTGSFEEGAAPTPVKPPPCAQPETFTAWLGRVNAGEPYSVGGTDDPVMAQIRQDFSDCHSAYYQPGWREQQRAGHQTAVFAVQGWTDDLFEAVESFRMFKYLKTLDPRWPVAVAVADVGHARAQNKPSTWRWLNNQANQFLASHIAGSHPQQTTVLSQPTLCANNPDPGPVTAAQQLTASTPEGLSNATLEVVGPAGSTVNPLAAGDPDGVATDAVVPGRLPSAVLPTPDCRESTAPSWPGRYTAVSEPLTRDTTYVGLGSVTVPYTLTGGPTATLHARVWVLPAAGGPALLVTRGTYRLDTPAHDPVAGTLRLPLYGNHWPLHRGDRIRFDLTQVDAPTYRPDNEPSALELAAPTLTLPVRSASDLTLTASAG